MSAKQELYDNVIWNSNGETKAIMFTSRNKDNKNVEHFKQRTKVFLTDKAYNDHFSQFNAFVADGVVGEMSRMYVSVNARNLDKVNRLLVHKLIDEEIDLLSNMDAKVAGLAMKPECAKTRRWLFDYDDLPNKIYDFLNDLTQEMGDILYVTNSTPNGHAIVVEHGFDTRLLLKKWENVSLKRDDMLCFAWKTKEGSNKNVVESN